jgi:hypothetical protein
MAAFYNPTQADATVRFQAIWAARLTVWSWPVAGIDAIWTEGALISAICAHRSPMRERTASFAVPPFAAAERLTVPDPLPPVAL